MEDRRGWLLGAALLALLLWRRRRLELPEAAPEAAPEAPEAAEAPALLLVLSHSKQHRN